MSRIRILVLIPLLGRGGAKQVTASLSRGLSRDKYDVHLGIVASSSCEGIALPPWVTIHAMGASRVSTGAFSMLRLVRRLKPEVILSGMAHLNFLCCC